MTENKNKERTSITIDPELLERARQFCVNASTKAGRKVSFSELVSTAVSAHIGTVEVAASTEEHENV